MTPLMNPQHVADPLSALRDIHLPEPVSWWPLAAGWWIVLGVALTSVLVAVLRDTSRRRLRASALHEVDQLAARCREGTDSSRLATGLSVLLRRVALVRFPDQGVASLHGDAWTAFLGRTAERPDEMLAVADGLEHSLYAPPRPVDPAQGESWIGAARSWIRRNA